MRTITFYVALFIISLIAQSVQAQEPYKDKIEILKEQKNHIISQEKEALKVEVEEINKRLEDKQIRAEEAKALKEAAAKKRALNIENRIAIIDNEIALLERNDGEVLGLNKKISIHDDRVEINLDICDEPWTILKKKEPKYDRRTYSDLVIAVGFNNALIDGQSLEDSPYKVGGSRFFEIGGAWRTRVFKNSNFMRFHYGFSFQFNGLKPKDNQYFVVNGSQTELQEFEYDLDKSKLRMDNLVFPIYVEFGPSKVKKTEKSIRYSLDKQFRIGVGAYGGFNLGTRQKLKYDRAGENVKDKLKRGYNTTDFIYGLSAYAGVGGTQLYLKYDLNPIFTDAAVEQHNISLGLRFDL